MKKQGFIIAVSGGPAIGKSTLVKKITRHYNAKAFMEGEEKDIPKEIWKMIKSGHRVLDLVFYFRNKTVSQYLVALKLKAGGRNVILDDFYLTNDVYIKEWIKDSFEREIAENMSKIDRSFLSLPDLIICLSANEKKTREFVRKRGRKNEASNNLVKKYLNLGQAHENFFRRLKLKNIVFVDRSELDFNSQKDFENLVKILNRKIKN